MSTTPKKTTVDLSKAKIGQKVKLRSGKTAKLCEISSGVPYPYYLRHTDGGQTSHRRNGRYWCSGKESPDDIIAILPLPKKAAKPKPAQATVKAWMVIHSSGELYSASNGRTKKEARMHHSGSLGQSWAKSLIDGDRIARVEITILKKHK